MLPYFFFPKERDEMKHSS